MPALGRRVRWRRLAVMRRRARAHGRRSLETLRQWARAEAGAGRLLPWVPVAFGTGIALLLRRRSRAGAVGRRRRRDCVVCRSRSAAAAEGVSRGCDDRSRCGRLCHRDLEDRADRAWRAGAADVFGRSHRLRRDPRHPRTHRPLRLARRHDGEPARADKTRARAAVGAEGHRAGSRQLRRIEGPAAAAAHAAAARQLRFRPRPVLSGHRRLRLRDGRDQGNGAAGERRISARAMPPSCRTCATRSTRGFAMCSTATGARSRPRC